MPPHRAAHRNPLMRLRNLLATALLLACSATAGAANPQLLPLTDINLGELLKETTWQHIDPQGMQLVLWMPQEYWAAFLAQQGQQSKDTGEVLDMLSAYALFAVAKGKPIEDDAYQDIQALRAAMRMTDPSGKTHEPLTEDKLPPRLAGLLGYMRPVLANSMGEFGKGMQFLVFPARGDDGQLLLDATATGLLRIRLDGRDHAYRLPLGALLVPMHDVGTGEQFPGNYDFNPYTGQRLQRAAP